MFKPRIHECTVEDDGESATFYVREVGGREGLNKAEAFKARKEKNNEPTGLENVHALLGYVVHKDGTALSKDEIDGMLDMRISALNKVSAKIMEKALGIKPRDADSGEPKNA